MDRRRVSSHELALGHHTSYFSVHLRRVLLLDVVMVNETARWRRLLPIETVSTAANEEGRVNVVLERLTPRREVESER